MKVLLIQSRQDARKAEMERAGYREVLADLADLEYVSALDITHSWDDPRAFIGERAAIIIGGSGDFDIDGGRDEADEARNISREIVTRLEPLVTYCIEYGVPLMGICFGHQVVAEMRGGSVTHDHSQNKVGTFDVTLTEEGKRDPIFGALPERFLAQYVHKDSVTSLPHGARILVTGDRCNFGALRYGMSVYTTQFHPELNAKRFQQSLAHAPGYVPEGSNVASLIRESSEASMIIPRFVEMVPRPAGRTSLTSLVS